VGTSALYHACVGRRLFILTAAASLLMWAATVALWVRSEFAADSLWRFVFNASNGVTGNVVLHHDGGRLAVIVRAENQPAYSANADHRWHWDSRRSSDDYAVVRWFRYERRRIASHIRYEVAVRYWHLVTIFAVMPAFCLIQWVRRPARPGACRACGYDLTGNTSGVCPECGTAVVPTRA